MTSVEKNANPQSTLQRPVIAMPAYDHTCDAILGKQASAVPASYINALIQANAIPLVLPITSDQGTIDALIKLAHGLLLIGGPDVDPEHFGQTCQPGLREVTPARDALELTVTRQALIENTPILAICRGIQVLNVAAGGSLFQDIANQLPLAKKHDQHPDHEPAYLAHTIDIESGSRVAAVCGRTRLTVNSLHHQAIDRVGSGLAVTARSGDGIIEAVETEDEHWVVGVQWHPEWMLDGRDDMPALFRAFCDACRSNIGRRGQPR